MLFKKPSRLKLGEILVQEGMAQEEEIQEALQVQKDSRRVNLFIPPSYGRNSTFLQGDFSYESLSP